MDFPIACFLVVLFTVVFFVVVLVTQYAVDQIKKYIDLMIETIKWNEFEYKNSKKNNAARG